VQIDLPVSAYIPRSYIKNEKDRINIYRTLGDARSLEEIDKIKKDMIFRYKEIPCVVNNLVNIAKMKYLLKKVKIEKLVFQEGTGIYLKKVNLTADKAKKLNSKNKNIFYEPALKRVLIRKVDKDIDLDLVLDCLNDIISSM